MFEVRILQPQDGQCIAAFEKQRAEQMHMPAMEIELMSWNASWREESLNHYLPQGWSFGLFVPDTNTLQGYFLAQPFLFFRSMTQTLWIERLVAVGAKETAELLEIAYKICREKHFQKLVFAAMEDAPVEHAVFQLAAIPEKLFELKTAKF